MAITMLREIRLAGQVYQPGQELPETVWGGLRERSRRSLLAGRYVTEQAPNKRRRAATAAAAASSPTTPTGAPKGPGLSATKKGS